MVIAPVWRDAADLVRAAGGAVVMSEGPRFLAVAIATDSARFDAQVRNAGAWAVIDAGTLAALCGANSETENTRENT